MAELDTELLERVTRWCADAGRQAGAAEIRAAIAPLGWDEVLAVRALLADPPPARPLGPHALADLARGVPPDVAAEREREGRYRREEDDAAPVTAPADEVRAPAPRRKGAKRTRAPEIVVRRARDRVPSVPEAPAPPPLLDELRLPGGRSVLERLIRKHGGRRAVIARALAAGWRRADGAGVSEDDVAALLDLHGLARPFERREHDELLHALRATGGVRARAAERVGLDAAGLEAALARVGAEQEAERIRADRRAELRARATLSDRVHLLLEDPARLEDLGILPELEQDLAARLPEHVRALRAAPGPVGAAFGESLSLDAAATAALAARFGLDLGPLESGERPWRRGGTQAPGVRPWGDRAGPDRPRSSGRDARPGPRDARSGPRDARPGPRDARPGPRDGRPGPRDARPGPRDGRPGPRDARPGPRDARTGPRDPRTGPRDARPGPRDARPGPRDARPGPRNTRPGARDMRPGNRDARPRPDRAGAAGARGGDRPAFSRPRPRDAAPAGRPPRTTGPGAARTDQRWPRPATGRPATGPARPGGRPGTARPGGRRTPGGRGPRRP